MVLYSNQREAPRKSLIISHVNTPPPLRRSRPLGHAHGRRALLLTLRVSRHPRTPRDVVSLKVSPCSPECWMNHHRTYSMPTYSTVGSPQLYPCQKRCTFQDISYFVKTDLRETKETIGLKNLIITV